MTYHADITPELLSPDGKSVEDIEVLAFNCYIDPEPQNVQSFVKLDSNSYWTLAVRKNGTTDALHVTQKDNKVLIQPLGMQVNYQHTPMDVTLIVGEL